MRDVYLDCSALRNIRLDCSDVPRSISIDGFEFIRSFQSVIDSIPVQQPKTEKEMLWESVVALSSNPQYVKGESLLRHGISKVDYASTAAVIIKQAEEIVSQFNRKIK